MNTCRMNVNAAGSVTDHNKLIRAATAAFDLVLAIEHGADTTALVQEIHIMRIVPEDLLDKPYQPMRVLKPARRGRRVTDAE
jgi:hypothetical protein